MECYFRVSNALDASISTYSFDGGDIEVLEEIAIQGVGAESPEPSVAFGETQGWIDLDTDQYGEYVYQLYGLEIRRNHRSFPSRRWWFTELRRRSTGSEYTGNYRLLRSCLYRHLIGAFFRKPFLDTP